MKLSLNYSKAKSSLWGMALAIGCLVGLCTTQVVAQNSCATTNSCTPGNATGANVGAFGGGIYNVKLGNINRASTGATLGYKDYTCTDSTTLLTGGAYPITIKTGNVSLENVNVYVDINNDGTYTTDELLFSSINKKIHTGNITLPAFAILDSNLRMRVTSDIANQAVPTA